MDAFDFATTTFGLGSGIAASIGYGVVSTSPRAAKGCCWVSALAFGSAASVWAAHWTDHPMSWRLLVGASVGAISGLVLTWALGQIGAISAKAPPSDPPAGSTSPITNNQGIVTQNQSGGVNTVNNHGPQQRRLADGKQAFLDVARLGCGLKPNHVSVTAAGSNNEAQRYASELVAALKEAGCSADLEMPIPGVKPDLDGVNIGIRSALFDAKKAPRLAQVVADALTAAKIDYFWRPLEDDFFPGVPFVLVIGHGD